jgi:SAM-dependent methyltransferase
MVYGKRPQPEDYISNFSPVNRAELHIYIVNECPNAGFRSLYAIIRQLLRAGQDANDIEAKKARHIMKKKWGSTSAETIQLFLSEKFSGDHLRKFEYPFLARCLARADVRKGVIVDMGGGNSYSTVVPMLFSLSGVRILSLDIANHTTRSKYGVEYVQGDCTHTNLPDQFADVVTIISTLEHVGLGRWGDPFDVDGDIKTMHEAKRILKPDGFLVLTIPYGFPTVVYNLNRIYDEGRLQKLCEGFQLVLSEYSLHGHSAKQGEVEGRKAVKTIPGFYTDRPEEKRFPDVQGGGLFLLKKAEKR